MANLVEPGFNLTDVVVISGDSSRRAFENEGNESGNRRLDVSKPGILNDFCRIRP